jgi:glucose-6-phosphate dehydrogenase assembly protein OpcA
VEGAVTTAVQPEIILKDLARLWVDLGKEEDATTGGNGVLRACAMTLVIATGERDDPQSLGETIAELMPQHPSRVIVLRVSDAAEDGLESRVFAQCWKPFGRRQQICCEQVEITASPSRFPDLPKLILGLTVPDLPVVLWSHGVVIGEHPEFRHVLGLPDKVIVDSAHFDDPMKGLENIRELYQRGWNVADLEWTRLTPWRESVAHIFDDQRNLQALKAIERIRISHTGDTPPVGAHYLRAWLAHTLPSHVELSFHSVAAEAGPRIRGVALEGRLFSAAAFLERKCAVVKVNHQMQRSGFPEQSECQLLREELSIIGVDTIFRGCLE